MEFGRQHIQLRIGINSGIVNFCVFFKTHFLRLASLKCLRQHLVFPRTMHGGNSWIQAPSVLLVWRHHQCCVKDEII